MTWVDWFLVCLFAVEALGTVCLVGEPRKPVSPGLAAATVALNAGLIILLVWSRTR